MTDYGVIAEIPHIGKLGQIFLCTCRKNYALDQKMNGTFYDGHDELCHHAQFGEDRTMRRCENVMFLFCFYFLFVTLRVRSTVRLRGA